VTVEEGGAKPTYNDPDLTRRLMTVFRSLLGDAAVLARKPTMGAEDFGMYGRTEHKVPICMYWLGSVDRKRWETSQKEGAQLPALHSPEYWPDPEPTIRTGILTMSASALELFGRGGGE
jgi:metal-dependent amidase/aminoacylase/carboxypeptidase family protein